jgi:tetratricopeptide (TPR) repeat protein
MLVEQYENSVQANRAAFFDQDDYESIVEYYEERGAFEEALKVSETALEQHPFSSALLIKRAQLFFQMKQCAQALELLDRAELFDASEIGIYLLRAEIYTFQSRYQEAIDILDNWVGRAEGDDLPDVYLQFCDVYEDWGKYFEMYDHLVKCLQADPGNEEALNRMNYCVEITQKYTDSAAFHRDLIDEHPYNFYAWYNLGCAYRGLEELEKAIEAFEYVTAIHDDADYAYQDIAELYHKMGQHQKSLDVLKDLCETFEADEDIYYLQGKCHEELGNMKMSRYFFRKALHENPALSEVHYRIGETYKKEGLWEQAYQSFQKANELEKEQYDFCLAMAEAALEIGEMEVGMDSCETAIDIFVKRHEAYILLAKILASSGDQETAEQIILKGLEVCRTTIELEYAYCANLFMQRKMKEGENRLRELLQGDSGAIDMLYYFYPELEEDPKIQQIIVELGA